MSVRLVGIDVLSGAENQVRVHGNALNVAVTGATSLTNALCPATPAAQQIKGAAGRLFGLTLANNSATTKWVKIFNSLSASVVPGTTAALTEIDIPPNQVLECRWEGGIAFSTGITIMITGGLGLTNNTAVTLGDVTGFTTFA
jgi:urease alpha subunit